MNCEMCHERLAEYLGDELPSRDRADVDTHLAACPACQDEVDQLRETLSALHELDADADAAINKTSPALTVAEHPAPTTTTTPPVVRTPTNRRGWMRTRGFLRTAAVLAIGMVLGHWWDEGSIWSGWTDSPAGWQATDASSTSPQSAAQRDDRNATTTGQSGRQPTHADHAATSAPRSERLTFRDSLEQLRRIGPTRALSEVERIDVPISSFATRLEALSQTGGK